MNNSKGRPWAKVTSSCYSMLMDIEDEKLALHMIRKVLQAQFGDIEIEDVKSENNLLNSFLKTSHKDILDSNARYDAVFNKSKKQKQLKTISKPKENFNKSQKKPQLNVVSKNDEILLKAIDNDFNALEFLQNKLSISEELSAQILNHRKALKVLLTERALNSICKEMITARDVTKHNITNVIDFYLINTWSSFKFYYYTQHIEKNNNAIKHIKEIVQRSQEEIEQEEYENKMDFLDNPNGKLMVAWRKIEQENKHLSDIEINHLKAIKEIEITKEYDDMIASKNAKSIVIDDKKQNFLGH